MEHPHCNTGLGQPVTHRMGGRRTRRLVLMEQRIVTAGHARYSSLVREFDVSEMTVRRDVDTLVTRGAIRRVTGGAIAATSVADDPTYTTGNRSAARRMLAERVVRELTDVGLVHLTPGPVSRRVSTLIASRRMTLQVVTTDVQVALNLADATRCRVVMPGGHLRAGIADGVTVHDVDHSVAAYHTDALVLDSVALHPLRGLSVDDPQRARNLDRAIATTRHTFVVADTDALGRVGFATICALPAIDSLVVAPTDADSATATHARDVGVTILTTDISG